MRVCRPGFVVAAVFALLVAMIALAPQTAYAQAGFDRPGGDYVRIPLGAGDPADCALRCERDRACRAWTFTWPRSSTEGAQCYLKNNVPERIASDCCVSGVRGAGVVETRSGAFEMATDRFGGDYRNFAVNVPGPAEACRAACEADGRCRAFTLVRAGYMGSAPRCFLKERVTAPRRKPCCIAGVVR